MHLRHATSSTAQQSNSQDMGFSTLSQSGQRVIPVIYRDTMSRDEILLLFIYFFKYFRSAGIIKKTFTFTKKPKIILNTFANKLFFQPSVVRYQHGIFEHQK